MTTDVSVVIPTRGRASLAAAVHSARMQIGVETEVIVVDASGVGTARPLVASKDDTIYIDAVRPLPAGAARAVGASRASGEWIAFLDDDDLFAPTKCSEQIAFALAGGASFVTCGYAAVPYDAIQGLTLGSVDDWSSQVQFLLLASRGGPEEVPQASVEIARYLFERRSLRGRKRIVTSSAFALAEIAKSTPWNPKLTRFEDWDWYLALEDAGGVWRHLPKRLVAVGERAPGSMTSGRARLNRAHIAWPIARLAGKAPRALGDVLVCDIGVTLAKTGDISGAVTALRTARIVGRPGPYAVARLLAAIAGAALREPFRKHQGRL